MNHNAFHYAVVSSLLLFLPLSHKYLLQHPALEQSQCVVLPSCVTVISNNRQNCSFVYSNVYVCR